MAMKMGGVDRFQNILYVLTWRRGGEASGMIQEYWSVSHTTTQTGLVAQILSFSLVFWGLGPAQSRMRANGGETGPMMSFRLRGFNWVPRTGSRLDPLKVLMEDSRKEPI